MSDIVLKGYVQKRRGVLTHLNERRLTVNEYVVFDILLLLADKETGSYMINAPAIRFWSGEQITIDAADRALRGLEEKDYIVREITPGKLGVYPYHIQKFIVAYGAEQGKVLTFTKKRNKIEKTVALLEYFGAQSADEGAEPTAEDGAEGSAEPGADKTKLETGDLKLETKAKGVSKSVRKSTPTASGSNSVDQNLETLFSEEQPQVQTLFSILYPNGFESVALFLKEVPHARACVEILAREKVSVKELLHYNKTHKSGGLVYRSCEHLLRGLTSETQRTLNDFVGHDPGSCRVCKAALKKADGKSLPEYRQKSGQREILKGGI
jgi:hypothetical protein